MKYYTEPIVDLLYMERNDILTLSGSDCDIWGDDIFDVLGG